VAILAKLLPHHTNDNNSRTPNNCHPISHDDDRETCIFTSSGSSINVAARLGFKRDDLTAWLAKGPAH
jgi:hypothetical protein